MAAPQALRAQTACFNFVSDTVGCAPFTVKVKACTGIPDSVNPAYYFLFRHYPDSLGQAKPVAVRDTGSFTYSKPGTYKILMGFRVKTGTGNNGGDESYVIRTVHVVDTATPALTLTACSGRRITAFITKSPYDRYIVDYGDGSPPDTTPQTGTNPSVILHHRYVNPFPNPVGVTLLPLYCGRSVSRGIGIYDKLPTPDSLFLSPDTAGHLAVRLNYSFGIRAQFRRKQGANVNPDTLPYIRTGTNAYTLPSLTASEQNLCLQITLSDFCSDSASLIDVVDACNLVFRTPQSMPFGALVTWFYAGKAEKMALYRNNSFLDTLGTVASASLTYTDTTVQCRTDYCYTGFIRSAPNGPGLRPIVISSGTSACFTSANSGKLPVLTGAYAGFDSVGLIKVKWNPPAGRAYRYLIKRNSTATVPRSDTSLVPAFTDGFTSYSVGNPACYQISYSDSCGNSAEYSGTVCPVMLSAFQTNPGEIRLERTEYTGYPKGQSIGYELQYLDAAGNVMQTKSFGNDTYFTDGSRFLPSQRIRYRIRVTNASGTDPFPQPVYSNIVFIDQIPRLAVPDAFSPNGDGLNDEYKVYTLFIKEFTMSIFNRWGQLIWRTHNPDEGWNGIFNGTPVAQDNYVCVINATDQVGQKADRTLTILVIR